MYRVEPSEGVGDVNVAIPKVQEESIEKLGAWLIQCNLRRKYRRRLWPWCLPVV
jgi:hypothetical protein